MKKFPSLTALFMFVLLLAFSLSARAQVATINSPGDQDIPRFVDTTVVFEVTNPGYARGYRFTAVDDKGFVVSVSPETASVDSGNTRDVRVLVNPGDSPAGTVSVLTFFVTPDCLLPQSASKDLPYDCKPAYVSIELRVVGDDKPRVGGTVQGVLLTTGATIDGNGDVVVWGFRGSAQQGNGRMVVSSGSAPEKVNSLSNVVSLSGGAYHLIALDRDGNVYGWGQSGYGETGCKPNQAIYTHTPCAVLTDAVQIAGGEYFSMALDKNGKVWTWGHNLYGQLGNGETRNSQVPVNVNLNGEKARLIGGAYEGAFAVTEEGHVWAWGDNEASGLGFQGPIYGVQRIIRTPTRVDNLTPYAHRITYIAGGNGWGQALLDDGTVIGWGLHAAIGQGTALTSITSPVPVEVMRNVKQLYARYVGSIALTNDGQVYTWGQTGGSAFRIIYGEAPTLRRPAGSVTEVGGGKEHVFYRTTEGTLYGVGYNDLHKLDLSRCCGPNVDWPGSVIRY